MPQRSVLLESAFMTVSKSCSNTVTLHPDPRHFISHNSQEHLLTNFIRQHCRFNNRGHDALLYLMSKNDICQKARREACSRLRYPHLALTVKHDLLPIGVQALPIALLLVLSFFAILQDSGTAPASLFPVTRL